MLVDPICIGFDVSPESTHFHRRCREEPGRAVARRDSGEAPRDAVGGRSDSKNSSTTTHPEKIVCDAMGPGKSLVQLLELAEIEVETYDSGQHAEACGRFVDVVTEQSVRHLGSLDLLNALRGAKTRPLGDRWAWS